MKTRLVDTNIVIRYFVEDPKSNRYEKIFKLFEKVEKRDELIYIDNLIIFESYFVLTSYYKIPKSKVLDKLLALIDFSGIEMSNKAIIRATFEKMKVKSIDLVDAYLIELAISKNLQLYTNDKDFKKAGIETIQLC